MAQSFEYGYNNKFLFVAMPLPNDLEYPYDWQSKGIIDDFGDIVPVDSFHHGWDNVCLWIGENPSQYAPQGY